MNLTSHLIRKDLRTLRWPLALWVFACITHAGLRIAQHTRGDGAPTTAFWRSIDNSQRWDYLAVAFLPVLLIPALMHLDPLRGQLAFWKSVPIDRKRLLTAKSATLALSFVALPLVCEIVYFASAGLAPVLPTALADWAWRYLPGVVAVAVGCAFAPSLKWGIPGVAALLFVAFQFLGWPMGRDRFAQPTPTSRFAVRSPVIDLPSGARAEIDPKSYQFRRTRFVPSQVPDGVQKAEERLALTLNMTIEGLPEDTVVGNLVVKASSIQLPGRVVSSTDKAEFRVMTYSSEMPAQEQREDIGRHFFQSGELRPNQWTVDTEYFPFGTKDVGQQGTPVEGKVLLSLARRKRVASLPLVEGAQWRPGLHRFTLSNVSPPQSSGIGFRSTLTTVLADPNGASGGLGLLPSTNIALWLEHQTSPTRKYLQVIPSNVWRATGFKDRVFRVSPQAYGDMSYGFVTDLTRSLKRLVLSSKFDPTEALRNQAAPLAVARFAEEQAQVRNWQLALIAYDDLGTIELPFKAVVPAPPKAREDQDPEELKTPLPSLGDQLAKIVIPENPSAAEVPKLLAELTAAVRGKGEDSIHRHEPALLAKLTILSRSNVEALLSAATSALPPRIQNEAEARFRDQWLLHPRDADPFWRRVLIVACDSARPDQKALFLRYHSPEVDLLRAIEPHGWAADALPGMCSMAANNLAHDAWIKFFAQSRDPRAVAALQAQIKQRSLSVSKVAELIDSGVLPARESASMLWETVVSNTANLSNLSAAFGLAVRHGVEVAPRDLLRILRLSRDDMRQHFVGPPLKTIQSSFVQLLSLRSDCPADVAQAATWLEQNAASLRFNDANGRYEIPGQSAPAPQFGNWGTLRDPRGLGTARIENGDLVMTAGGATTNGVTEIVRFTREVEGDFTVEVTVQPKFDLAPAWSRSSSEIFQTAGLMVFAEEGRWLRWEHGLYKDVSGHQLREETMRAGKNTVIQRASKAWDPAKPLRLRISRHGDLFATAWSQEGGAWVESPAFLNIGWPRKVQVGPWIGNRVTKMLSARFSDFKLTPSSQAPTNLAMKLEPQPEGEATPSGTDLGPWGKVENPIGAGIFKTEGNALSIAVAPKNADYHVQQRMTAPRVVREVNGDFTFETTIIPTPKRNWSSAELLIASGFDFYLRIGIAAKTGDKVGFTYDYAGGGWPASIGHVAPPGDLTKPFRLRLQRRGWFLTIAHQQEGGEWTEFYPLNLRAWPAKLQVGVIALNTSSEPFTAQFSDLKLTSDSK